MKTANISTETRETERKAMRRKDDRSGRIEGITDCVKSARWVKNTGWVKSTCRIERGTGWVVKIGEPDNVPGKASSSVGPSLFLVSASPLGHSQQ